MTKYELHEKFVRLEDDYINEISHAFETIEEAQSHRQARYEELREWQREGGHPKGNHFLSIRKVEDGVSPDVIGITVRVDVGCGDALPVS